MFELGEYPCGGDDVADSGWAGGDALQGTPAGGQQGEAAFPEGALATLKGVVGQVVDREDVPVARLLVRDVDALAGALVAAVGEGGQVQLRCRPGTGRPAGERLGQRSGRGRDRRPHRRSRSAARSGA